MFKKYFLLPFLCMIVSGLFVFLLYPEQRAFNDFFQKDIKEVTQIIKKTNQKISRIKPGNSKRSDAELKHLQYQLKMYQEDLHNIKKHQQERKKEYNESVIRNKHEKIVTIIVLMLIVFALTYIINWMIKNKKIDLNKIKNNYLAGLSILFFILTLIALAERDAASIVLAIMFVGTLLAHVVDKNLKKKKNN